MTIVQQILSFFLAEPYEELKEKLQNAMKTKDPEKIAEAVDNIDAKIPIEKVPEEDRPVLERARKLAPTIQSKTCKILMVFQYKLIIEIICNN